MTGEITLTGQVLPIGGVKEKVLAADRAGIGTSVVPRLNEDQLVDVPEDLRERMRIVLAERLAEVLAAAFADPDDGPGRGRLVLRPRRSTMAVCEHAA